MVGHALSWINTKELQMGPNKTYRSKLWVPNNFETIKSKQDTAKIDNNCLSDIENVKKQFLIENKNGEDKFNEIRLLGDHHSVSDDDENEINTDDSDEFDDDDDEDDNEFNFDDDDNNSSSSYEGGLQQNSNKKVSSMNSKNDSTYFNARSKAKNIINNSINSQINSNLNDISNFLNIKSSKSNSANSNTTCFQYTDISQGINQHNDYQNNTNHQNFQDLQQQQQQPQQFMTNNYDNQQLLPSLLTSHYMAYDHGSNNNSLKMPSNEHLTTASYLDQHYHTNSGISTSNEAYNYINLNNQLDLLYANFNELTPPASSSSSSSSTSSNSSAFTSYYNTLLDTTNNSTNNSNSIKKSPPDLHNNYLTHNFNSIDTNLAAFYMQSNDFNINNSTTSEILNANNHSYAYPYSQSNHIPCHHHIHHPHLHHAQQFDNQNQLLIDQNLNYCFDYSANNSYINNV